MSIRDYLEDRGIEYWEAGSKNVGVGWIGIQCLYCDDHSNHLGINLKTARVKCWLCHTSISVIDLIKEIENCSYRQAKAIFDNVWEGGVEDTLPPPSRIGRLRAKNVSLPPLKKKWPKKYLKYLESRNFDPDYLIKKYKLLPGEVYGDYSHRIIIPFFKGKKLVTFCGMDITKRAEIPYKDASYQDSLKIPKEVLYNSNSVRGNHVVIVEGYTDVWRCGDGTVGLTTNKISDSQILELKKLEVKRAFVLLDADAHREAEEVAAAILGTAVDYVDIGYLEKEDPDKMSEVDLNMVRKFLDNAYSSKYIRR